VNIPTQTTEPIPVDKLIRWLADPEGTAGERSSLVTDGMLMRAAAAALLPETDRPVATIVWPTGAEAVYAIVRGEEIDTVVDTHGGTMPRPRKFEPGDQVVYIGGARDHTFTNGWNVLGDDDVHTIRGYLSANAFAVTFEDNDYLFPDDSFLTLATGGDEPRQREGANS
jgi:hypothetical protein